MRATGPAWRLYPLAVLVLALLAGSALAAPKDDDKSLQEKALKLNEVTGDDPTTGMVLSLLDDKEGTKKLLSVAHKMAREHPKDKPPLFNINATWILARAAHHLKETDISEYFYRQNAALALKLYSSKKFVNAYSGLLSLLYSNQRYAEAEKICKEVLELPGDENIERFKFTALETLVRTLAKQEKGEQALRMVENLVKNTDNPVRKLLFFQLKGWVLRETGKFEDAARTYEDLLEKVYKIEDLKDEVKDDFAGGIRYTLSGVYIDLKKVNKAAEHLEALLKKDEKNPTYNNDLGFIWADHDMKLDEAERLIRRAIEEDRKIRKKVGVGSDDDKDNPAYLDSLGWVLYKKKKFKDALPALQEAVKHPDGQHLEIYDHLAEVYIALGETDKAIETWKKGLTCKDVSKRDAQRRIEVEKKIKKHEKKD